MEYIAQRRRIAENPDFERAQWRLHGAAMNIIQASTSQETLEAYAKSIEAKFDVNIKKKGIAHSIMPQAGISAPVSAEDIDAEAPALGDHGIADDFAG